MFAWEKKSYHLKLRITSIKGFTNTILGVFFIEKLKLLPDEISQVQGIVNVKWIFLKIFILRFNFQSISFVVWERKNSV